MLSEYNDVKLSITLKDLLNEYEEIIIPRLQRDYVMGANKDLFDELIQDLQDKCMNANNNFDFGCIIGNCSDNKFYIYDGQQRLATLVIMACLQLDKNNDEDKKENYRKLLKKFKFEYRNDANEMLYKLLEGEYIEKCNTVDLTMWSIVKTIKSLENKEMDIDKLMKNVVFKCMPIDEKSTAEQLFFDLNEGVILKDYEIFKSELDMQIRKFVKDRKILNYDAEEWFDKIDNEWLEWCYESCKSKNKSYSLEKIEEKEMRIILYIIKMIYIENSEKIQKNDIEKFKSFKTIDIEWIQENFNENMFVKTIKLMNSLIKIESSNSNEKEEFFVYVGSKTWHKEYATRYFNLNYLEHDKWMINNLMDIEIKTDSNDISWAGTVNEEILLWTCINLLNTKQGKQDYIRLIKKLLNQNRRINDKCYYYVSDNTVPYVDHIQFSRQIVNGNDNAYDYNLFHLKVIKFIKSTFNNNTYEITKNYILEQLNKNRSSENKYSQDNYNIIQFEDICTNEYIKYKTIIEDEKKGEEIELFENDKLFNGIIGNVWNECDKKCYIDYSVFNCFFKYDNCLDNREKDACKLLSILQLQANEVLLYDNIFCGSKKVGIKDICIPNKDIIDIMVSSGDKIAINVKEYFKNYTFISHIGKFKELAYALGAEKDFNDNKTGRRERIYINDGERFKLTRPEHRANREGEEDQTASLNSNFISRKDINQYCNRCVSLVEECEKHIKYYIAQYKSHFEENIDFEMLKEKSDLEKYFFELVALIIGDDFKMNEFVINLIEIIINNNNEIILRGIKLEPYYKNNKDPGITIEFLKEELVYFIYHNKEGKIIVSWR